MIGYEGINWAQDPFNSRAKNGLVRREIEGSMGSVGVELSQQNH